MSLRPTDLDDIIGQDDTIKTIKIAIDSAKKRNTSLGHTLIEGPSGLGKSSICYAIANAMGSKVKTILGSNISSFKDVLPTLSSIKKHEILFIDEIHQVNKKIAESFYTIMEDFVLDLPTGKDKEIVRIRLPTFTLLGATTEAGTLEKPMIERFKFRFTLHPYSIDDLSLIIENNANQLNLKLDQNSIRAIAKVSRGTPRIANRTLEWVRDYSVSHNLKNPSEGHVWASIGMLGIDRDGLTKDDKKYLRYLTNQKRPVGLDTLAAATGIDRQTIVNIIEPFLLSTHKIVKTPKGRQIKI